MSDPSATDPPVADESSWSGPTRAFPFPVELGQVLAFRRAIGERTDDADTAPAPPTFASAVDLFDPGYVRRPPRNRGWNDGFPESLLHVEQRFDLLRPLRVGDRLVARRGPGRTWTKQGRTAGRLQFLEDRTELRDHTGALVAVVSWVDVRAEHTHTALTNRQVVNRQVADRPHSPAASPGDARAEQAPGAVTVVEHITRTQFVQYVAAVGDYHPLHHDEELTRAEGYPSVFAPGMLTMGLSGRAVTDRYGDDGLRSYSGRFRAQVWPGDTLTAVVEPVDEPVDGGAPPTGTTIGVTTRNQLGTVVFEGRVTYGAPPEAR